MKRLYKHHYIEKQCKYRGIEYTILLNEGGWRTAYLNVTGSVLQNVDYTNINLDVHGGLTYSASYLPYELDGSPEGNAWYIGWDYAHAFDGVDSEKVKEYFGEVRFTPLVSREGYKIYTLEDVKHECIEAINELHEGKFKI